MKHQVVMIGDGWAQMNRHPRRRNITQASLRRLYRLCEATRYDYTLTSFCTVYHVRRG